MDPRAIFEALQSDLDPALKQTLAVSLKSVADTRKPDVIIGRGENDNAPYMLRWWLMHRNKHGFNLYLHKFLRSDDDRALHDHPWPNISIVLDGSYKEHLPLDRSLPNGQTAAYVRNAGDIVFRDATDSHRIELFPDLDQYRLTSGGRERVEGLVKPAWSLFVTGEKIRDWGFWCGNADGSPRWVSWQKFTGQDEVNGPVRDARVLQGGGCGEQ